MIINDLKKQLDEKIEEINKQKNIIEELNKNKNNKDLSLEIKDKNPKKKEITKNLSLILMIII